MRDPVKLLSSCGVVSYLSPVEVIRERPSGSRYSPSNVSPHEVRYGFVLRPCFMPLTEAENTPARQRVLAGVLAETALTGWKHIGGGGN
jgi:hypothetical protein